MGQFSATDNISKGPTLLEIKNSDHDGLFVTVEICHIPIHCLVDTGSTMRVLHTKIFKQLPKPIQNKLKPYNKKLGMADWGELEPLGNVDIPMEIDEHVIDQQMLIAEVEIPAVLGFDFLEQNQCINI